MQPADKVADPAELCVVIVSYRASHHLLDELIGRVLSEGVGQIVIVFNGNFVEGSWSARPRITPVPLAENLGSAAGFGIGLERARQLGSRLILLLDDDNLPHPGCIASLLIAHRLLGGGDDVCLQAYRPQLEWHRLLLTAGVETIALPNTYAWFHLANERHLLRKQLGGQPRQDRNEPFRFPIAKTRVACYGGLLLPAAILDVVALPDPRYFCYYDDIEFTDRISGAGIGIYLCSQAIVADVENSWHVSADTCHPAFSALTPDQRIYLDIRNATHFTRGRVDHLGTYLLNAVLFWIGVLILALFRSSGIRLSLSRIRLIFRAVRAGMRNQLGPYELP